MPRCVMHNSSLEDFLSNNIDVLEEIVFPYSLLENTYFVS